MTNNLFNGDDYLISLIAISSIKIGGILYSLIIKDWTFAFVAIGVAEVFNILMEALGEE